MLARNWILNFGQLCAWVWHPWYKGWGFWQGLSYGLKLKTDMPLCSDVIVNGGETLQTLHWRLPMYINAPQQCALHFEQGHNYRFGYSGIWTVNFSEPSHLMRNCIIKHNSTKYNLLYFNMTIQLNCRLGYLALKLFLRTTSTERQYACREELTQQRIWVALKRAVGLLLPVKPLNLRSRRECDPASWGRRPRPWQWRSSSWRARYKWRRHG